MSLKSHIEKLCFFRSNSEWYYYDDDGMPNLTKEAPPEAKESYEYWRKHDDQRKNGEIIVN